MEHSDFKSVNLREFFKTFVLAIVSAIIVAIYSVLAALKKHLIDHQALPATWLDWKAMLIAGAVVGVTYFLTTFFSNSEGAIFAKEKLL